MRAKVAGSSSRTFLIASRPLLPPVSFGSWNASFSASRNAVDILSRAALCRPRLGLPRPKRVEGLGFGFAMRAADYHHSGRLTTAPVRRPKRSAPRQPIRLRVRHAPDSPPADPTYWFRHCHVGRAPPSPASRASRWRDGQPIARRPTYHVWFWVAAWLAPLGHRRMVNLIHGRGLMQPTERPHEE